MTTTLDSAAAKAGRAFPAILFGLLLVLSTLAVACGGGDGGGGAADPRVAHGEDIFKRVCATCHGQDAMGMPRLGKGLRGNAFVSARSDAEMVEFLKTGRPAFHELNTTGVDMPPKGGDPSLTDDDLAAVVAYLRTL